MKIPILMESMHGAKVGVMTETTTATVTRESNQFFALNLVYPRDGRLANKIKRGMVILATVGYEKEEKDQKFRIYSVSKTENELTITANCAAADLDGQRITSQVTQANATPTQAFNGLQAAFAYEMPEIKFSTNIDRVANTDWEVSDDSVATMLMGADQAGDTPTNTIQGLYDGNWKFNNYNLTLLDARKPHDSHQTIKWRQNLSNLTEDETMDDYYDGIVPYAKYNPNEVADDTDPNGQGAQEDYDGQGDVQYVGSGGATTYSSPYKDHTPVGTVQNGHFYHVQKVASDNTVNNDTWYQLDDGSWIDEHFFTFDKSGAYVVNKVNAQGHVKIPDDVSNDSQGLISTYRGVGSIVYSGRGQVKIWNSPFSGHSGTGQYVSNGTRWKITRIATDYSGKTWYDLGYNQWVDGQYLNVSQQSDYVSTPSRGILQILKQPTCYTSPRMFQKANWNPRVGSRWHITSVASGPNDETLYQVSTNIWVVGDDDTVSFSTSGTVQPNTDNDRIAQIKATGKVPVYSDPNGQHVTDIWETPGTQFVIQHQAEANGKTWYEIGEGKWIDSNYVDFSAADDVAPGEGDDDSDTGDEEDESEEVTLMLSDKYILANTAVHTENPRLKAVDLSSYVGVQPTEDTLRQAALQWMKEYRIGILPISLSVGYEQLQGEYRNLTKVDLYDLVTVRFPELGINVKAMVNSVTWDCLLGRYTEIVIGQLPIEYDHALGQYVHDENTKTRVAAEKKSDHLFGQIHQILQLKGDDLKAGIKKLSDALGMDSKDNPQTLIALQQQMDGIDKTATAVKQWIDNPDSTSIIHAQPNWQNPTALVAQCSNGGYMKFDSKGLEFVGPDDHVKSAIGANEEGFAVVEHITGGTMSGITIDGVTVKGKSYLNSVGGQYNTVMSTDAGFSVNAANDPNAGTPQAIHAGLSPYQLVLYDTTNGQQRALTGFDLAQIKQALNQHWGVKFEGD